MFHFQNRKRKKSLSMTNNCFILCFENENFNDFYFHVNDAKNCIERKTKYTLSISSLKC